MSSMSPRKLPKLKVILETPELVIDDKNGDDLWDYSLIYTQFMEKYFKYF